MSETATADIDRIFAYIARENPSAAKEVVERIYEVIRILAIHPGIGRKTIRPGVRQHVVTPYRYVILFRHSERRDLIRVLAVRHGAQRRPALQEEGRVFRR